VDNDIAVRDMSVVEKESAPHEQQENHQQGASALNINPFFKHYISSESLIRKQIYIYYCLIVIQITIKKVA